MIPISEKSSGGALVDWVPEGHDRKYTEPAAMSIRIAATPSAWAFDFCTSDWTVEEPNSSSGCLSRLGPLRAGRRANPPPVPSERRLLVGGTDGSNLLCSSRESGCPGLLFEEVGFAVDTLPEEAGFEFAFLRPG